MIRRGEMSRFLAVLAALTAAIAFAQDAAGAPLADQPIDAAIAEYEAQGVRIFYSTDLVKPWMRVARAPLAQEPRQALAEILAPHGLTVRVAANGTLLIVRAEPADMPPASNARAQTEISPDDRGPSRSTLEEVIVSTSQYPLRGRGASRPFSLSAADIRSLPDAGDDALRPLAKLPGLASNGFSAQAHVRGGEVTETLIRFDGLRLYEPYHLKDFQSVFSVVDPRVVGSIDVYTGGFPAAFGDRMSSVIDVDSMPPQASAYHEVGFSFFNTSVLSAGPVNNGQGHWLFSARRSNLDLLYRSLTDLPDRPQYLDAFAKFDYVLSPRLTIAGNLLRSSDDLTLSEDIEREERASADHLDSYYWVRLDHQLSESLHGRTLVARASLDSIRRGESEKFGISTGSLTDRRGFAIETLQSEWSWLIGSRWLLDFGGSADRLRGEYAYTDSVDFDLLFDTPGAGTAPSRRRELAVKLDGYRTGAHVTVRRRFGSRLTADFGLRWDSQNLAPSDRATIGPRVGVRFDLLPNTQLRASVGRFHQSQAINELQISDGENTLAPPQRSDHLIVGIQHVFRLGPQLRAEIYRKEMTRLRPRFENLLNSRILLPELKPDRIRIVPESGRAQGLEIMLESGGDKPLRWWLGYSRSEVYDRFAQGGIARSWDEPHSLDWGVSLERARWTLGLSGNYRLGWPTTPVTLDSSGPIPIAVAQPRNSSRLGRHVTLDLIATRSFQLRRSAFDVTFELTNVLGRRNPCCVEYEIGEDESEAGRLLLKDVSYLPLIPSIGFLWSF